MKLYNTLIILIILFVVSCKENDDEFDTRAFLERIKIQFSSKNENDIVGNIETAISKYENKQLDQTPIIIWAFLLYNTGGEPSNLDIECYDEQKDIVGIGIKEKSIDSDGKEIILIEEYPVLTHRKRPWITSGIGVPVKIRNTGQRKSEQKWNDYIKAEGIEQLDVKDWRDNLPDIWISMQEPNQVEVEMYIYDKEGNKSNSIIVQIEN